MIKETSIRELSAEEVELISGGADFSGVRSSVNSTAWIVETHGRSGGGGWAEVARNFFFTNALLR